jgi:hypothetical protein
MSDHANPRRAKSITVGTGAAFGVLTNPDGSSVKRIALAFGTAKKDSDEERELYLLLRDRFAKLALERDQREDGPGAEITPP